MKGGRRKDSWSPSDKVCRDAAIVAGRAGTWEVEGDSDVEDCEFVRM